MSARVLDRFEQEQAVFFERVRAAYLTRAAASPRIRVIDAAQPLAQVQHDLQSVIHDFIAASAGGPA
jgi:dTMP kinase